LVLTSRKFNAFRQAQNTVIAIVATDAKLSKAQCHRVATAAHDGIARACVPAHTPNDGDIIFALSNGDRTADTLVVGHAAALCLSRAIARAVYAASSLPDDPLPSWQDVNRP
jgi:D-aminopeptidase